MVASMRLSSIQLVEVLAVALHQLALEAAGQVQAVYERVTRVVVLG
jgi:hypothetical protein